jgi:hypothetical protein
MTALALMIRPTDHGWGVYLTNGEELVQYRGFFSKQLALRYLQRYTRASPQPRLSLRSDFWRWRRA